MGSAAAAATAFQLEINGDAEEWAKNLTIFLHISGWYTNKFSPLCAEVEKLQPLREPSAWLFQYYNKADETVVVARKALRPQFEAIGVSIDKASVQLLWGRNSNHDDPTAKMGRGNGTKFERHVSIYFVDQTNSL
jgi:hypothetical protein